MALFTEAALRSAAAQGLSKSAPGVHSASEALLTEARAYTANRQYDIFLSHSFQDAVLIYGLRNTLVGLGFTVYVDWIEDVAVDRRKVSAATADMLRQRMKQCKSLLYATSEAATESRWMPWELGYFDALRQTVAVAPISKTEAGADWTGREYLGLYPYVDPAPESQTKQMRLWVRRSARNYVEFREWLGGRQPSLRS